MATGKSVSAKKSSSGESRKAQQQPATSDRQHMISEAAYFLAQQRGFVPGQEMQDWLQAEQQVDALVKH